MHVERPEFNPPKLCKDSARLIAGKKGTLDFLKSPLLLKRVKAKGNGHKLDP